MPNLSLDNIENSLFNPYPTRNRLQVVRTRSFSVDNISVDYTQWSNDDFSDKTESEKMGGVDEELNKKDAKNTSKVPGVIENELMFLREDLKKKQKT